MSASREPTAPAATTSTGVSFEVERFRWIDGARLEVAGRWYGIRGRRFLRPTLDVEVDGHPRRMLAVLEHKPWAADDGEEWVAAFEWAGDPVEMSAAELAVAPELAVELPPPSGAPATSGRPARSVGPRREARPPRTQALEAELAAARAEVEELRLRVAAEQRARGEHDEQLEAVRRQAAAAAETAATERDKAAAERDAALAERDNARAERSAALSERDDAVAAREAALADREAAVTAAERAAAEREAAARKRAAVERELEGAIRARDKARAERNEWLTRARAAAAQSGPEAARKEATGPEREAAAAEHEAAPREREAAAPAHGPAARAPRKPPIKILPPAVEHSGGAPGDSSAEGSAGKGRRTPIPPSGILLSPTRPGSHMRRSILPGWAPRVLAPIALVILIVVVALLIAWAT